MNEDLRTFCARLLARVQSNTTDTGDAHQVPVAHFIEPQHLAAERECLFMQTPQVIGFSGELSTPNSYKTVTVLGKPVLLTRDGNGQLHAFLNACQHRGALLVDGWGINDRFSCPFHGWTYANNGQLIGRRDEQAFTDVRPVEHASLTRLPVSDRAGLLVVGMDPNMAQQRVDSFLETIDDALQAFDFSTMKTLDSRRYTVKANWKLVVNLSNEGYHFQSLHRDSLAPMMSHHGVVDYYGEHTRWAFALHDIGKLTDLPEHNWPDHFPGAINHTLFPGTVLVAVAGGAQLIRAEPGSLPGEAVVHYSGVYVGAENSEEDAARREQAMQSFRFGETIFADEDLQAAELCQRGLESGALTSLVAGSNEPLVGYWHRLWNEALTQHLAQADGQPFTEPES